MIVHQGRCCIRADVYAVKRIIGACHVGKFAINLSLQEPHLTIAVPDERVEQTIAINITQGGGCRRADINTIEWIVVAHSPGKAS
jgi:hypothetical protein